MKKRMLAPMLWALGCMGIMGMLNGAGAENTAGAELVLIAGGKSDYAIVVPDGPDVRNRVKRASDLLQSTLAEAAGVKLPVVKESELKAGTPAIYVGRTQAAAKAGLPLKELKGWTFLKQVKGKDVFLAGIDDTAGIEGAPYIEYFGSLKAVTSFLEDEAGVRFLLPGPNGIYIPKHDRLCVKADLNVKQSPIFEYVIGRSTGENIFPVANNYLPSGVLKSYGGHSYYDAVPNKKYVKDHPEYFALIGGVRTAALNHLCISNPEVQELMIREMEKWLDQGYAWVELAQTDGYQPCECAKCVALHPDPAERIWIVHRKLAERIEKERPGKKVVILSYGPTADPPRSFKKFTDNVVIQMCNYRPEAFDQWQRFNVEKTVYIYNWGNYQVMGFGPKRTPRYAGEQVQRFAANKVRGIYMCGAFEDLGLEGPVFYVYGKLMGKPSLNYTDVADEFYEAAYGKAQAPMKAFFTAMYDRLELYSALSRPNFRTEMKNIPIPLAISPEDWYCNFFPAKLLAGMAQNLERAKAAADDPRVQARIRLVEREFDYVKNLATIFQMYQAYRLKPGWETFDLLAAEIEKRNSMLDSWYDEKGNFKPFDGWPIFFLNAKKEIVKDGGEMTGLLSAPVNWNTKLLKQKQVLPGVGSKTARAPKISGITLDGKLDDPAWQGIKAEELGEIGMGELKNGTTFKLAYDDRCLYLGFECALDTIDYLNINPLGHDGGCWGAECLEIFLDPFGAREKYYHFIFNPAANSFYEARRGFIADPLHPLYNKEDPAWNGAWEYVAVIDKPNRKWTAEMKIPFSTLGVETPQAGTAWTMNIGREEYPAASREVHPDAILSLWSPNLEERDFGSLAAFGNVVFE